MNDKGVTKYCPVYGDQADPSKKYFKGDMQQLKSQGYLIYLETRF